MAFYRCLELDVDIVITVLVVVVSLAIQKMYTVPQALGGKPFQRWQSSTEQNRHRQEQPPTPNVLLANLIHLFVVEQRVVDNFHRSIMTRLPKGCHTPSISRRFTSTLVVREQRLDDFLRKCDGDTTLILFQIQIDLVLYCSYNPICIYIYICVTILNQLFQLSTEFYVLSRAVNCSPSTLPFPPWLGVMSSLGVFLFVSLFDQSDGDCTEAMVDPLQCVPLLSCTPHVQP